MPLCRHSVGTFPKSELTLNLSGNIRPQSSQLAEPLWTGPGLKSGISVRELISTSEKEEKKPGRGMNCRTFSQNPCTRGKSHHATSTMSIYYTELKTFTAYTPCSRCVYLSVVPSTHCSRCVYLSVVPSTPCNRCVYLSVVPSTPCSRCVYLSVVACTPCSHESPCGPCSNYNGDTPPKDSSSRR